MQATAGALDARPRQATSPVPHERTGAARAGALARAQRDQSPRRSACAARAPFLDPARAEP